MRRLPKDFEIIKYGLNARLVKESDAEFIVQLRTDPKLGKYLHKTDSSIENQRKWIKQYKEREEAGTEYYFIFYKDGKAIGLNRLYDIGNESYTSGSWLFSSEAPFGASFLAQIILREMAFLDWGMQVEVDNSGVHIDNVNVRKFNKLAGMQETGSHTTESGEFMKLRLEKDDFIKGRSKILRLLGIKEPYHD